MFFQDWDSALEIRATATAKTCALPTDNATAYVVSNTYLEYKEVFKKWARENREYHFGEATCHTTCDNFKTVKLMLIYSLY